MPIAVEILAIDCQSDSGAGGREIVIVITTAT
jgi:hypothetical protein